MRRLFCSDFSRTTSRKRPEERLFNISDQHQSRIYPPSAIRCSTNAKWSFFSFANSRLVHANFAKTSAISAITAVLGSIMLPVDPKNSYYRSDDPLSSHPPVESHPHFYSSFFNYTAHFPGTFPSASSWYLFCWSVCVFLPLFFSFLLFFGAGPVQTLGETWIGARFGLIIHRSEPMPKALTFELIFLFHFFCSGICERVLMRTSPV